jgi:hypothetical protein
LEQTRREYESKLSQYETKLSQTAQELGQTRREYESKLSQYETKLSQTAQELEQSRSAPAKPEPSTGYYAPVYDFDGLRTNPAVIHNHDFMKDHRFIKAYARGVQAQGEDQKYYWRVHVALWCAAHAIQLQGDFVECGVWKGFLSSAIMRYLDWNSRSRIFFLFDTFCGIDESQVTREEKGRLHLAHYRKHYLPNYEEVKRNFAEFKDVVIVKGSVPATLGQVQIGPISYLSLDMNNVTPEVAAAQHFWDRLVPGGDHSARRLRLCQL